MTQYSKINIVYRLQKWMDSVPGQTFLNYAYSWGAAIVILGTLFKLTHLPGANFMLFLGMGTEVIVFFLSAFDRPFDKTADGLDIPTHVTEEYLEGKEMFKPHSGISAQTASKVVTPASTTVIRMNEDEGHQQSHAAVVSLSTSTDAELSDGSWVAGQQVSSPELAEATSRYVDELKKLTETLEKVSEQSVRLTRDSEEMENLNRTLTGICKVYEMQLKGASQQIGTIDQINEQSRKMAQQIEQLNSIYARMIEAMTINMRANNPGV